MRRKVDAVRPDTLLRVAARKMNAGGVPMLPVCEDSIMVGMLTARDITVRATAQGCDPRFARVRDVMMAPTIFSQENQDVDEATEIMERRSLHRLPVLDQQMHLVGVVSLNDLCKSSAGPTSRRFSTHGRRRIRKGH